MWITWICETSTGSKAMWRSAEQLLSDCSADFHICYVVRHLSQRECPPPRPPCQIPSPTHFPGSRCYVLAGFFGQPAGVVIAASCGRHARRMGSSCACGTWFSRPRAWNGRCLRLPPASGRLRRTCCLVAASPRLTVERGVGPMLNLVGGRAIFSPRNPLYPHLETRSAFL